MLKNWSKTSVYHYYKLLFRCLLFLLVGIDFIRCHIRHIEFFSAVSRRIVWFGGIVWLLYMVEMLLRMFPSKIESMGCQKQFSCNCTGPAATSVPKSTTVKDLLIGQRTHGRFTVFFVWILLNGTIGVLYYFHIINEGVLMLISMFYSVCDIICILFFCPFQTWFMKNRCCVSCYIYNWDYAMMFTPLVFIPHPYTYSLFGMALLVLLQWEIRLRLYPQRFDRRLNDSLSCKNCQEKLCRHKKQLQTFIRRLEKSAKVEDHELLNRLLGTTRNETQFHEEENSSTDQ